MSNKGEKEEKLSPEELQKLEDEAYFELCQIIAEAMQLQDIELLDYRIAVWKKKYKKLLENPLVGSKFKKRIEYLLNEYYSSITLYIWQQLKKQEQKRIEKQYKAMRKLYKIIDENNDIKQLEKQIEEWKKKYPVEAFLEMYQKKIKRLTSEKNIKENAFDQDKAFYDLYRITKNNGTYDELKNELKKWKEKYRIDSKFKLDDFIKNQSDVKRYTSDEYLNSIAKKEAKPEEADDKQLLKPTPEQLEEQESNNPENYEEDFASATEIENSNEANKQENNNLSDNSKQAIAYAALIGIAKEKNNLDKLFNWVHKYGSVKFNDEYKQLILAATYLEYSPKYLNYLKVPNINVLQSYLTIDEFKHINEIKRYAVISYFNLLLPPSQAIPNDNFYKYIREIYFRSKSARIVDEFEIKNDEEDPLSKPIVSLQIEEDVNSVEFENETPIEQDTDNLDFKTDIKVETENETSKIKDISIDNEKDETKIDTIIPIQEEIKEYDQEENIENTENIEESKEEDPKQEIVEEITIKEPVFEKEPSLEEKQISETTETIDTQDSVYDPKGLTSSITDSNENNNKDENTQKVEIEIDSSVFENEPVLEIPLAKKEMTASISEQEKENLDLKTTQEHTSLLEDNIQEEKEEKEEEEKLIETRPTIGITMTEATKQEEPIIIKEQEPIQKEETVFEKQEEKPEEIGEDSEEIDISTYSKVFIDTIYDYSIQADLIKEIDDSAQKNAERVFDEDMYEQDLYNENTIGVEKNQNNNY